MKKIISVILALMMTVSLAACGSSGEPAPTTSGSGNTASGNNEVYKIILAGSCTEDHPTAIANVKFKEICEAESNGRIQVELFTNNALGNSREVLDSIRAGEYQMTDASASVYSSFTEEYMFVGLPFLFNDRFAAYAFFDGEVGKEITEEVAKQTGLRALGYYENGFRQLTNNKHTVRTPDDMKGLKIRVMESPLYIEMFEEMGAAPTPMAFAELYTALQQKTVDGQDNSYAITVTNALYEVQSYMTALGHNYDVTPLVIGEDFYQSLPDDLRAVVDKAAAEATAYNHQVCQDTEAAYIKTIEDHGVELTYLTDEERQAFRDATAGCVDFFKQNYNPVISVDYVLEAIDAANNAN